MQEGWNDNGSVWSMVFTGNWVAFAILLLLLILSALSWAIIFSKWLQFRKVHAENNLFYHLFQKEKTFADLYATSQNFKNSPMALLFEASYREISVFRQSVEKGLTADMRERLMESLARRMETVYNHQNNLLERRLGLLAIISSAAPYIGLFGTVLGIIDSFRSIGQMGVTSLAVVAPGISEALVATAGGLMAAIPALIAYNLFRNRIREMNSEIKNFALDVTNRLERLL